MVILSTYIHKLMFYNHTNINIRLFFSSDEGDELDSNLTLTCTMIDLICELLAGIESNNTLQQEAVVRWTKLLFGNISEPVLQVRFLKDN